MTASAVRSHTFRRPPAGGPHVARPLTSGSGFGTRGEPEPTAAPVVVGVDGTASGIAATHTAVSLASDLGAPLVLVSVRQWPSSTLGEPYYQRRLDAELAAANRDLSAALAIAEAAGVPATTETLHGAPARQLSELARYRRARLIVLGPRRTRIGRSVSRRVVRTSDRPVVVAGTASQQMVLRFDRNARLSP
jgi:nucleotide-binding universal stress UspA family protein